MQEVKEYTVFISCPSDVSKDREVVENTVKTFSETCCSGKKITFKTVHLDKVPAKMGKPAQEHIHEKINDYDLYIGLMGKRFGTPTKNFGSGTEDEFRTALKKCQDGEDIYVSFLFKDINLDTPSIDEMEQYIEVKKFKESISDDGLYMPYNSNEALNNEITKILADFVEQHDVGTQNPQYSLITEVPSSDAFIINKEFFNETLNSLDANISNGHKERITLGDVYVPLDMSVVGSANAKNEDCLEETINASSIEEYNNQESVKYFVVGDESSGKTAFCRRVFLNFHSAGIIPVIIDGSQIKTVNQTKINKIIENAFKQQYREEALACYKELDQHKKLLIIDNLDASSLNNKHKLLTVKKLENTFGHVIATADHIFLFNTKLMTPEEYNKFGNYQKYQIDSIGHKIRDELTRKWLLAGREHCLEDYELYKLADQYGRTVENILGSNYVPRRPFVILVLLQGIHCGTTNSDLTHSSFVRYYQFLIDETLLKRVSPEKVWLYYAFLPELAYLTYKGGEHSFTKGSLDNLINEYAEKKDIDTHDLIALKGHLITLGMLAFDDDGNYKFKHKYTYFYFLGQYFEKNLNNPEISSQVTEICERINLHENANIIIFLSYHTDDPFVIGTLLDKAEKLFSEEDVFDFGKTNTSKINQLVSQAPKMILEHGKEKSEREKTLKHRDNVEKKYGKKDNQDLNVLDFGEQIILTFRTIEIIGQLLKNHADLDAGPKQEMFTKATNLSMRSLNALVDHFLDIDQLMEFIRSEDSANIEDEEEAREIVFALAHLIITCFIKAKANFT
ncbi:MAG: DUF4062 domain-containing protein, partial [Alphaproteobacteria bacterium]|nr:DUF4062 domain-containing protein [Alphaproteobacteria bacterium]